MIKYIKRKEIDVVKYDYCIENSLQSRTYAFSWYLDIVTDNWDALVLDDYEAVMPIPWKQKFFLKHISQPPFCQQLGVFSLTDITANEQNKFLKKIPLKILKISLSLNAQNFSNTLSTERKNYILNLKNDYKTILKSFSKGRKHAVKVGVKNELMINAISIVDLIEIKEKFYSHGNFSKDIIEKLANYTMSIDKGFCVGVFKEDILLGGGFFLKSNNRITYLFSSFNTEGRNYQAASFLISNVIQDYQNTEFIIDFEGGNIPNIGSFFRSFGAVNENYYHLKYSVIHSFLQYRKI